ncbi:MAG: hypothetical protein Q9210_006565, partial [Variospora velana]
YGVVFRAQERASSKIVALKQIRIPHEERQNGVPITALREISILRSLRHENIVNVLEVAVGEKAMDEVYMVMEYCEQAISVSMGAPGWLIFLLEQGGSASCFEIQDMAALLDEIRVKFTMSQIKCLFRQLLSGLDYLHSNDIVHRDVKMQNILLTAKGVLKLADFGMARAYSVRPLTPGVVTIWYRAPELLLGTKYYTPAVDVWSAGLVLAELIQSEPCLTGETPVEQLSLIVKLLGSPTPDDLAALSAMGCPDLIRWRRESLASGRADNLGRRFLTNSTPETVNLLRGLLTWHPRGRWTAAEALGRGKSPVAASGERWWTERPRATEKELIPTFPEIRNGTALKGLQHRSKGAEAAISQAGLGSAKAKGGDYIFDFEDERNTRSQFTYLSSQGNRFQIFTTLSNMTRRGVYIGALVAFLTACAMTLTSIIIPRWISWDSETPGGQHIHYTYGLHRRCSSLTGTCDYFPRTQDCHGDRHFCSMWRSVGFLMSFAVVIEGMTLVAFIVIVAGGKQKREQGWKVLGGLLAFSALVQCAGMAIIAFLYDNDDRFFPGWRLDNSWVLCTVSWSVELLLAAGITAAALILPSEGGYELIPDAERED